MQTPKVKKPKVLLKMLTVRLPKDDLTEFRRFCETKGLSMNQQAMELIQKFIAPPEEVKK